MGGPATPQFAASVSNAGALGMLALTWADDAGAAVQHLRGLTEHPFGGNFGLHLDQHERLDAALEAGLRVVSLFWGDPGAYVDQVHAAGALLLHSVGSAEEARRAVDAGVDVIVAQGLDAGGHVWGQVGTLSLVPAVVDAVDPTPVIAAGGIGDGRGVAAVLALGAQAAWVGTRFLMAAEAPVHERYRRRLIEANETDALWFPDLFDGGWPNAPHRALRNTTVDAWEAAGRPPAGSRPDAGEQVATRPNGSPIPRYMSATPVEGMEGDIDAMSLWAGQGVALARGVQPAAEIVADLVSRL